MTRRRGLAAGVVLAVGLLGLQPAAAQGDGCTDPGAPAYSSHECKVERLRARPFAVIAVVDSGINPYHVDFRLPPDDDLVGVHPSEFIEGYPADADRMQPSFDAPSLSAAKAADAAQWERARGGALTWIDGTIVVGARTTVDWDFFDTNGHGTGVASQAAGRVLGPDHPDVLLVVVNGFNRGLEWAAKQSWIDVVTNSWSVINPVTDTTATATWAATDAGKIVCFATGNLTVPLWFWQGQGPSWHVNVGAARADTREETHYSGSPADVIGLTHVPAADHTSMDGESEMNGTSGATPAVCGWIAHTIARARARFGDSVQGPHAGGALAVGEPAGGYAGDGRLTRAEIEDAVMATAAPTTATPGAHFVRGGYGIVDATTVEQALEVLFGDRPRPERDVEDRWMQATNAGRDAVWGPPPG